MEPGQEMGQESPSQAASQPKKTFSKTWLVLGILIVVLGIGGWFAYANYFSSPQVIEPTLPPTTPQPADLSNELMEEEMKETMEQEDEAVFQTVIDDTVFTLAELIAGITQGDVVIAGMRVQHVRPFREELSDKLPLEENIIVDFEGEVELTGEYYVNEFGRYCIHNLTQESLAKVPTLDSTQVLPWICFTNTKDVSSILGSAPREVTVTISDYSIQHHSPEPPNWATLVSVKNKDEFDQEVIAYSNDEYGFSFNHPDGWNEYAVNDGSYTVVAFESSDTEQLLEEGQLPPGTRFNVVVNYWPSFSDFEELAPGIEVANLDELIEENTLFTKVGELQVDGYEAREIIWGGFGQKFAVLIDKDGEFWMLNFERFENKEDLSEAESEVINSLVFNK